MGSKLDKYLEVARVYFNSIEFNIAIHVYVREKEIIAIRRGKEIVKKHIRISSKFTFFIVNFI